MKRPFLNALGAALYIVFIVLVIQGSNYILKNVMGTIIIPMVMLSLFVLSAAIMGYFFLSEPLQLLMENKKKEAVTFFAKVVGVFACFILVFGIVLLIKNSRVTTVNLDVKININVVCESALTYMSFPDATLASKFVAECKEGKHPEVIEHYKAQFNLAD